MKKLTYRLNVYVTIPVTEDDEDVDLHTAESATTSREKRRVELDLYSVLRENDYDADVEIMDFEVSE